MYFLLAHALVKLGIAAYCSYQFVALLADIPEPYKHLVAYAAIIWVIAQDTTSLTKGKV